MSLKLKTFRFQTKGVLAPRSCEGMIEMPVLGEGGGERGSSLKIPLSNTKASVDSESYHTAVDAKNNAKEKQENSTNAEQPDKHVSPTLTSLLTTCKAAKLLPFHSRGKTKHTHYCCTLRGATSWCSRPPRRIKSAVVAAASGPLRNTAKSQTRQ